ncbi:assimilatory sulfite reductase (NADPH) flavoprotein subunit [Psychromonas antarctica]|uniref:assimilatory sulfite reductase (NADPH) flavoprotein subunit n=1 Tax=Psychromonas antarctica TaxID=67573 RepID=UPI001EE877D1|nr:assimilatory sulfite reductase (NADPH) flavoprotein subunit [Psychromonas antarctica]MCG6200262.1 assimilatory sulfite reductase (NADPH) flavoprotein subunit [Psychromonas antarctica]
MALNNLSALTSPLSELQLSQLQQAMLGLTPVQTAWVSGYLAAQSQQSITPQATAASGQSLTILYGTQTGNAKGVAEQIAEQASSKGIANRIVSMADYKIKSIKDESHLIIVASTNGEGEAPDDAIDLHQFLATKKAPQLDNLKFAVLGLGDSSYEFFCQTGKDFAQRISALCATEIVERLDADVDYEQVIPTWIETVLTAVEKTLEKGGVASVTLASAMAPISTNKYDKQNPFAANLLVSQKITGEQSAKDVRHIEIDLQGSDLTYTAGDALGVWFKNDSLLVAEITAKLNLDAATEVKIDDTTISLADALIEFYELTSTHPAFVAGYAALTNNRELLTLTEDKNALREFANNHQIIDVISDTGNENLTAENFLSLLRRISPRLYSIASSQAEVDEEVHLTIGSVLFNNTLGQQRSGGASGFLNHRLAEDQEVKVFIEDNHNFRLPSNPETPIIMVGPGTGIAPFRAFMQEREATDAMGKNWLFFGEQTFNEDFLYQVEWQAHLKSGLLSKLDLAFSRDQTEKIYVQDRLKENAADVYQWLQDGAHFYVCGDANRMAKDVQTALIEIISEQGKLSTKDAEQYLTELRQTKRYQRDVY